MIIVIMGVTGSGKSTVGNLLAQKLCLPFIEADDFHSEENIIKMGSGSPLTDEDRLPWLKSIAHELQQQNKGAVLACSALKESYRNILQRGLKEKIIWILLDGPHDIIKKRIKERQHHFMPEELLQSQIATLEKPLYAYSFSIKNDPETIVEQIMEVIKKAPEGA